MLPEVGWWALLQYRMASGLHRSGLPALVRLPLPAATVLGHFGTVVIHADVVIGLGCTVSPEPRSGCPVVGTGVGTACSGTACPRVRAPWWSDGPAWATTPSSPTNAAVTRDVPAGCTVPGSPAAVDELGTRGMGLHEPPRP